MQATYLPTKARYLVSAAAFSLLLNTGMAQAASTNAAPETTTTTTTTTTEAPVVSAPSTESPTVMTPFEVDSSQDTGYRARSSLAGSRVNTDLNDIANPITVVTKDFLTDIGAVDVNDILTYEVGTEGTKDFSSNTSQLGRTSDNATQDPAGATRGRGLAAFDFTRDYFYSLSDVITGYSSQSIGFDTYNVSNITISRGADSILAGLGSPAGIINIAPAMAGLEHNSTDISYRYGSYSDQRSVLNANIVAIPDVLGFYVAGLYANKGFEQQPAYDLDRRYYLAVTYKPFKKTIIHASYEDANVHEHLPNTFTPEDDITQWIQLGKPVAPASLKSVNSSGVTVVGSAGNTPIPNSTAVFYPGLNSGPNVYYNTNGSIFEAYNDAGMSYFQQQNLSGVALWQPLRMSNDEYGDWHDLNTSGTEQRNTLSTINVSIDQELLHGLNLNVGIVHEIANYTELNLGRPDFVADMVDVNPQLADGSPNPFLGNTDMYFAGLDNQNATYSRNTVARATLTYDLDLTKYNKWFGRYVATAFAEDRRTTHDFIDYNAQQAAAGTTVGGGPGVVTYTGGNSANNYFTSQTAILPTLFTDVPFLNPNGTVTNNFTTVYALKEEEKDITKLTTTAIVLQAYLLDNLAVGTFGLRRDVDKAGFASSSTDSASGLVLPLNSDEFSSGPLTTVQAQTKTYGVVLHGPKIGEVNLKWLSVGYDQSQNFIPNAGSIDLLGNPTADPTGTTKDYSIMVDLFGGRLNAKIDWYTTVAANAADATVNFPLVQWTIPFEVLENNGGGNGNGVGAYADLAHQIGFTGYQSGLAPGITTGDPQLANAYTSSQQSKGMEFELTYNVTKNWRVFGTVTRQQAEESNIAPALTSFINGRIAYWQANGLWNGPTTTKQDWCGCPETGQQVFNDQVIGPFIAYQAASGQPSQQLHKWKATLVTNYTFDQGIAKGLGIGTGIRYFDKTILGNPAIVDSTGTVTGLDLAHPYTVPGETSVEAWITYSRKIFSNKYLLSFRLEADNLQTNGGYLPVAANSDGTHQLFTIAPPRTYYFTTELKF
jgi:outer membrane receptor protein involved in Fe transport